MKLVIVDDDMGELLGEMIETHVGPLELQIFTNGDEAWADLSQRDPDVLITDIQHPGLGGWEILRLLAAQKVKYPIVVLTGYSDVNETICEASHPELRGLNITVMNKPFEWEKFNRVLTSIIRNIR